MIYVIGIGPGKREAMTLEALSAIEKSHVIVGYKTYIQLVVDLCVGKEVVQNGMRGEIERCQEAVAIAKTGKTVAVISSGDAGVYGMAGLVLELVLQGEQAKVWGADAGAPAGQGRCADQLEVVIIPGVTASSAAAALAGAPLMHDYCHISLSDLLTPLTTIHNRLKYAALGDFVMCLYNPRSQGRPHHLEDALAIVRKNAEKDLSVVVVKDAYREGQQVIRATLDTLDVNVVDMTSLVIIGNSNTKHLGNYTLTPRGYHV